MSTTYVFQVTPCGARLALEHNLIMPDTWTDTAAAPTLIVAGGFVDSSQPGRIICHSGPDDNAPVVTLIGATWDSQVGESGAATCDLCQNTPNSQTWLLASIS